MKAKDQLSNTLKAVVIKGLLFCAVLFGFNGCQSEYEEVVTPSARLVLEANSDVVKLIERVTMLDGSYDNILDGVSCFSVKLPVTVVADGQIVTVTTVDDLMDVERIFDKSPIDIDVLQFVFPIVLVAEDYSEITILNDIQFNSATANCRQGVDDDIECIDFKYPLTLYSYDSKNQSSNARDIVNDRDLFDLFLNMQSGELIGFKFPVTMITAAGVEIVVNDNVELQSAIESHITDCDEDDDNDFHDDDTDDTAFVQALTNTTWYVSFFMSSTNETATFDPYVFTFNVNKTAVASDGNTDTPGTWDTYGDNGFLAINLDFGGQDPLNRLFEDWEVVTYTSTRIELHNTEGTSTGVLILEKK